MYEHKHQSLSFFRKKRTENWKRMEVEKKTGGYKKEAALENRSLAWCMVVITRIMSFHGNWNHPGCSNLATGMNTEACEEKIIGHCLNIYNWLFYVFNGLPNDCPPPTFHQVLKAAFPIGNFRKIWWLMNLLYAKTSHVICNFWNWG